MVDQTTERFQDLIAPEILQSYRAVSPKADVWAFGCCLYQWLTGALPSVHSEPLPSILEKNTQEIHRASVFCHQPCAAALSVCGQMQTTLFVSCLLICEATGNFLDLSGV